MARAKKTAKKAEKPRTGRGASGLMIIVGFALLGIILELASRSAGLGGIFGDGLQLAAVPSLIALFLLGYDYAIYSLVLTALLLPLLGATSFEVVARLASWLPVPAIAAFAYLAAEGKWKGKYVSSIFFGFFAALLIFEFAALFATQIPVSNPFAPTVPVVSPGSGAQPQLFLTLGEVLLGAFPAAMLVAFAALVFVYWLRSEAGKPDLLLGDLKELGMLALIAVPVKAAAATAVYFYYSGPALLGMAPQLLLSAQQPAVVLGWTCVGGVLELLIAWLVASAARRYRRGFL